MARSRIRTEATTPSSITSTPPDPQRHLLRAGDRIRLEYPNGASNHGRVDTHTADHSVLWVHLDDGQGRSMVLAEDAVQIVRQDND
ncbi:hypothetical protein [Psychromicrobium xiongbiense]|uniref:hypothetical protein n=1 Tax=Psychromicrobium xiongbiense TaxID=3051184 RepID=UPI00255365F2|nr:hypothetical protein [Psychromicrobium sp. YIM S02556]